MQNMHLISLFVKGEIIVIIDALDQFAYFIYLERQALSWRIVRLWRRNPLMRDNTPEQTRVY